MTSAQEYRKKRMKTIQCPKCGTSFVIRKASMIEMYKVYMMYKDDYPTAEELQKMTDEEYKKDPRILNTAAMLLLASTVNPKIGLERSEDMLSIDELDPCCIDFLLPQITEFSELGPKARAARTMFAKSEPGMLLGAHAVTTGVPPSVVIDPKNKVLTDVECALLNTEIMSNTLVTKVDRPKLEFELDQKYNQFDQAMRMWA